MKKYPWIILLTLGILLTACTDTTPRDQQPPKNQQPNQVEQPPGQSAEKQQTPAIDPAAIKDSSSQLPVTRAMVAKMVALTFNDRSDLLSMDREIQFTDSRPEDWYDLYINAVAVQGYMNGGGTEFGPDGYLTLNQTQVLIDRLDPNNKMKISMDEGNQNKPISYGAWIEIYTKMLQNMAGDQTLEQEFGIQEEELIIVATPGNSQQLKSWTMATDKGTYGFAGLVMDAYVDRKIKVQTKDGEIFAFLGMEEAEPVLTNVYITAVGDETITIFVGGVERIYQYNTPQTDLIGQVADLHLKGSQAQEVTAYDQIVYGRILRADRAYIELREQGIIPAWEDMKFYSITGEKVSWKGLRDLLVGSEIADFVLKDGKVCAALIKRTASPETIRVALHTSGFGGLIHPEVAITGTTDFILSYGGVEKEYKKGEILQISANESSDLFGAGRLYIQAKDSSGKLQIQSISRNWSDGQKPQYRGTLEIAKQGSGYSIVNELPIEEYLYGVVPSEMPTSHGLEAAKVQAVTARSYAYTQLFSNRYYMYGGNVDDSVQSQVYNNISENQTSIQAVDETKGLGLTYNGSVVSANFFSTSGGSTANSGEVWANSTTRDFPASTPAYLTAAKQYTGADYGDLRQEENAYRFFTQTDLESYDKAFSWFRWNVTMTTQELSAVINGGLKQRYEASPKLIRTLGENNVFRSRPIENIGDLKDIQILKRGEGGNVMELVLVGSKATVKVVTEYNIRMLLKPQQQLQGGDNIVLNRIDGSKLANYSLMPSAFFVIDKQIDASGSLTAITFYGGGNGHGVGMSQNGVKGMVDQGFNFQQILQHYYGGTEIKPIW